MGKVSYPLFLLCCRSACSSLFVANMTCFDPSRCHAFVKTLHASRFTLHASRFTLHASHPIGTPPHAPSRSNAVHPDCFQFSVVTSRHDCPPCAWSGMPCNPRRHLKTSRVRQVRLRL